MLLHFINDESGAVTVDWVMLTAAAAGLGMAMDELVTGGVNNMVTAITHQLSEAEIAAAFDTAGEEFGAFESVQLALTDFASGSAGWSGGNVTNISGFGDLMVLGAGQSTTYSTIIPSGASSATFTFDLVAGDSIDNETAVFTLNGQEIFVARSPFDGSLSIADSNLAGVTIQTEVLANNTEMGGRNYWSDNISRITVTVENPDPELSLTARSNTNQGVDDEFYGIDNFSLVAE